MFFIYTPLEYNNMRLAKLREFPGRNYHGPVIKRYNLNAGYEEFLWK